MLPEKILKVWKYFDGFPMETLTKAWMLKYRPSVRQRTIEDMEAHRRETGASGNCFDLAIWLQHQFRVGGVKSYAVGESSKNGFSHVGNIALDDDGRRYLCDLGDLWIQPILIDDQDSMSMKEPKLGYFAGAAVNIKLDRNLLQVTYLRTGGKTSEQSYELTPISESDLIEAGNISQGLLSKPLVEMRIWQPEETVHWEFDNYRSFTSSVTGLHIEAQALNIEYWASRISANTGMNQSYVLACLRAHSELANRQY